MFLKLMQLEYQKYVFEFGFYTQYLIMEKMENVNLELGFAGLLASIIDKFTIVN